MYKQDFSFSMAQPGLKPNPGTSIAQAGLTRWARFFGTSQWRVKPVLR